MRVPPRKDFNFSTGQGDNSTGTAFEPQGRIFVVPLSGTDTTDFTYGTLNLTFHGELSGPGTSVNTATFVAPADPFSFEDVHDFTNWSLASKQTIHERIYDIDTTTYLLLFDTPPYTDARAVIYVYDPTNPPDVDQYPLFLDRKNHYKYTATRPTSGTFYENVDGVWTMTTDDAGLRVSFGPGVYLPVTTSITDPTIRTLPFNSTPSDASGKPMLGVDENNNPTALTTDSQLRQQLTTLIQRLQDQLNNQNNAILQQLDDQHVTIDNPTLDVDVSNTPLPVEITGQPIQTSDDSGAAEGIFDILGGLITLI
jgi:hypothetical protein